MSKMFPFITTTWNPVGGECLHDCSYCWAKKLAKDRHMEKYIGTPTLNEREMQRKFKADDFVFVSDMCDLFGAWVPSETIQKVLDRCRFKLKTNFLFLTKNPGRYTEFLNTFLKFNATLGATVESDCAQKFSKAPSPTDRLYAMYDLEYPRKFLSIEPIMAFNLVSFSDSIRNIPYLQKIAIGYDNYFHNLPEPPLATTQKLIQWLRGWGYEVIEKTLREPLNVSGKVTK
jgi:DNA repair photolyase